MRGAEMRRRGGLQANFSTGGGPLGSLLRFLDDIRQLKAHAVLLIGIVSFAVMVAYYSGQMFSDNASRQPPKRVPIQRGAQQGVNGAIDQALQRVYEETQNQLIISKHTEAASAMARKALAEEAAARNAHRVTAILVFKEPGVNLNLALRSVAKRSFIKEVLLVHDLGPDSPSMKSVWKEPPTNVYGKQIKYLPRRGERAELLKFDACASDADPRNDVCYYQSPTRDTSNYLESLFASFVRAPQLLHTSVGATTFYSDMQLTFREDAFGIDAGFAYLKAGAFFRRKYAAEFIADPLVAQTDSPESEEKMPDLEAAADVYFSLWLNRPHCELANDIVPYKREINEPIVYERNAFARRTLLKEAHIAALKKLLATALMAKVTAPFRLFAPKFSAMRVTARGTGGGVQGGNGGVGRSQGGSGGREGGGGAGGARGGAVITNPMTHPMTHPGGAGQPLRLGRGRADGGMLKDVKASRRLLGVTSAGLQASKVLASSSSSASFPSSASLSAANVPGDLLQNERERHAHLRQSDKGVPAANKDVSAPNTVPKRTRPNGVPLKPVPLSHAGSPMSKVPLQLQASFPSRAVGGVGGGQRGGGGGGGAGVMGGGERAATGGGGMYGGLSMGGAGFKAVAAALKPTAEQSLFLKSSPCRGVL